MSAPVLTVLLTAGVLGVTHAIEPDHVAGISSLTSEYGDSRLSALIGACFSLGHVVLVVAWLAVAYALLGWTEFPAVYSTIGTASVGVVLGVFGAALAVGGLRRAVQVDEHNHGDVTHSHPHVHLPLPGFDSHQHGHNTSSYLKTGLVGALFTLSPPVSMIVFSSTLLPDYGEDVIALAVITYAATIIATMSLVGASVSALFSLVHERSVKLHATAQAIAGIATTALAVSLILGETGALL